MAGFFTAQSTRPQSYCDIELNQLSPLNRAALCHDGTLTSLLSAYYNEPVDIALIKQKPIPLVQHHSLYEFDADLPLLQRETHLVGRYSGSIYAFAQAILPTTSALANSPQLKIGLGNLLRLAGAEQFRELLWYGLSKQPPSTSQAHQATELVGRRYRIYNAGKVVALITEHFPIFLPETSSPLAKTNTRVNS